MRLGEAAFSALVVNPFAWSDDWAWGLPLIVLTVAIHAVGFGLVGQRAIDFASKMIERGHPRIMLLLVVGTATLLATCLLGIEAGIWALAYRLLGALPDFRSSMLFSLNAMTSYGQSRLTVEEHWHLMGALEALNGSMLFGLTTALLFALIQKVWVLDSAGEQK